VKCGGAPTNIFPNINLFFANARGASLFALAMFVFLSTLGCKREHQRRLTPAQVHQVTQELAKSAADTMPTNTVVKIRRARNGSAGGAADELYIGLRGNAGSLDQLRHRLDRIATQHRLTVDAPTESGNTLRITLRSAGIATHRIQIEIVPARATENSEIASSGKPRLAILLDDLGSDRGVADAIFALHVPVTISVLPYKVHSQEIAQEARKRGCEVLLHLPMQSLANEMPEQQELRPGLSRDDVERIVTNMLEAVPEADGVNNHQGSQATSNRALMDELMPVLKDAGVFYVDSRTTAETVAYETARRAGVKTAFRNVPFLDDIQNQAAVKRQLQIAIQGAKEKGEAIAIGHPHTATLEALREMLPQAKKQGVQLVFVSDVVH
jgi:uncharacterized protein